ncbi:PSD1 and planctomycete cytochrome C domain-containing protein [Roseimaritima multifibrata]|uniref:PSD1 and planctomycete cytochrome C domain-containing protein n=1 Tax=Roseimaritima multifibrata TaxID=1930274 RepID=UPI001C54F5B1|nr:PSD1 and planctomycete cytochrome C domain-containing protein [Roseimaritima multifibrata]
MSFAWVLGAFVAAGPCLSAEIDFNTQIRPILAAKCFHCHGPDEGAREAGLRLDTQEGAFEDLGGYAAVVGGDAAASELLKRVRSEDPDIRMPPPDQGPVLSQEEQAALEAWVQQGAKYKTHWAFEPPVKSEVPNAVADFSKAPRASSAIDHFVRERLRNVSEQPPSQLADRYTLIRRLSLDLTGLPPTVEEADAFAADDSPVAYERLVDRLLASPAFAEHVGRDWLDLARYADTNGYEKDRPRTIWPYRDWVLQAIAADEPFDRFSIAQLAGDMLPNATAEDRIATGFHRNTMLNEEGGIDPLEYRFYAMVDRVATTGTVWMGLTTGCAQCHTHKYDPITHTDYYALMALLNNADEPEMAVETEAVEAAEVALQKQIDAEENRLVKRYLTNLPRPTADPKPVAAESSKATPAENVEESIANAFRGWLEIQINEAAEWSNLRPEQMKSTTPYFERLPDDSILAGGDVSKRDVYELEFNPKAPVSALRLEVLPDPSLPANGPGMAYYEGRKGDFFLSEFKVFWNGKPIALENASHDYGKISVGSGDAAASSVLDGEGSTGWSTSGREGQASQLVVNLKERIDPAAGENDAENPATLRIEMLFERHFAAPLGRFRISATDSDQAMAATSMPVDLLQQLAGIESTEEAEALPGYADLQRLFLDSSDLLKEPRKRLDSLRRQVPTPPRTMVFTERPAEHPRATHRHHRGEFLQVKELVEPDIPSLFGGLGDERPHNRLELARWLVSEENPLVARVMVNRIWRSLLGSGFVRTDGDFGTQSEPPSHPALLDYLAIEWIENGWSMKWLYREMVLSTTYRQASEKDPDFDPTNRWLSRGPRFRLAAEAIRDQNLAISGTISRQFGGPSVYPPQPGSVTALAYGSGKWEPSVGADRYRRSLYTFRKRTAPFAAYTVFDAPTGEACAARRQRSDTPLQALTLLNDEMFLETARQLAEKTVADAGDGAEATLIATQLFRHVLIRPAEKAEQEMMLDFYNDQIAAKVSPAQAWFLLARALMNTDEAITKP